MCMCPPTRATPTVDAQLLMFSSTGMCSCCSQPAGGVQFRATVDMSYQTPAQQLQMSYAMLHSIV